MAGALRGRAASTAVMSVSQPTSPPWPRERPLSATVRPASAIDPEPAPAIRHVRLMGARIAAVTEADAVRAIIAATTGRRGHWTITANLDHLRRYQREPTARGLIDEADLVLADGVPLIWASRLAGAALPERVAGSDIIWSISQAASRSDATVFLLGGDPGVADRAAQVLRARYAGLRVVGTLCPPVGFEADERTLERIGREVLAAAPQIVFVGLGFPKQDLLIKRLRSVLPGTSFIGVGISLSFVAGEVSRAPRWTRSLCLEWAYRLLQEPRRLARRYVRDGVPFAIRLLGSAVWQRGARDRAHWGWDLDSTADSAAG